MDIETLEVENKSKLAKLAKEKASIQSNLDVWIVLINMHFEKFLFFFKKTSF